MRRSRFTEEQIIAVLREHEAVRYERRADIHLALATLACAVICLRQIRRFCP